MRAKDIEGFDGLLADATDNAEGDWETGFVSSLQDQYDEYGKSTFISDKQLSILRRIANGEGGARR